MNRMHRQVDPHPAVTTAAGTHCAPQPRHRAVTLRDADRFAINILEVGQEALSNRFATKSSTAAEKFVGVAHKEGALGVPLLTDALAHLECSTAHAYPGGDHTIFVGQVEAASSRDGEGPEPLLYYRGRYNRLQTPGGPR